MSELKFALEVRQGREAAEVFAEALSAQIQKLGGTVITDDETAPDIVVGVGGDGTMLGAVRRSLIWDVPVIGFNLGTIGFLAEAEPPDLEPAVQRLIAGDYDIDERTTVAATIGRVTALGVNDVVVEKIDSTRLVSLDVVIDGEPFVTYRADGLIVATPTGSTAYSFSAGGPLVDHGVHALVMTPVSTHSLFDRPLVLPDTTSIEVTVSSDRPVKVNVDKTDLGQLDEHESVTISKGDRPARFVSLSGRTFSGLVKDKFGLN
ncbi:MAG: NAD(+)/NADH kinase [Acidobacteria bacterium]|nr:MAG: NAD(+)/NADH kinase [Acidobacteriota bacterium]